MKIESLLEDLDGADPARAEAAAAWLTAEGGSVVTELLAEVAAVRGSAGLKPYTRALGLIGPPAFDALVE
ncbi:hypothetical protein ACFTZM_36035, partial [Streptomyces hydrogenans]